MSVEQYGARLLGEVQEESLEQLLAYIRRQYGTGSTEVLGVDRLDRLLEIFRLHQPQATPRHPGWTSPEDESPNLGDDEYVPAEESPRAVESVQKSSFKQEKPATIEISSTRSAAGKTTLLYHLTALATLPKDHGGNQSTVVWLDTDNRFSALRLSEVICGHLSKANPDLLPDAKTDLTQEALKHVHVLKPQSSAQLLHLLKTLPDHLLRTDKHFSSNRVLGILILDSATAFYWQDRFDAEMARLEAGPNPSRDEHTTTNVHETISLLQKLQTRFECILLFTTDPLTNPHRSKPNMTAPSAASTSNPNLNLHIPPPQGPPPESSLLPISPWTSIATLSLLLTPLPVPQFAASMALESCLRDREKRSEVVRRKRVLVAPDWALSERWAVGVREALGRLEGMGRGAFVIGFGEGEGIVFE